MAPASHVDVKDVAGEVPGLSAAAAAIASSEISVDGYMAACLRRVASEDGRLGAFAACDRDYAEKRAYVFDRMPVDKRGPLHGIPCAVSAGIDVKGGAPGFAQASPAVAGATTGAAIVEQGRREGAIVIGITASAAFGCFGAGSAANPYAATRSSGGSGAAAAVASGMVPLAFGWRPDGAIPVPAGYCGVYGLKPSRGAISSLGIASLAPSLGAVGLFVREAVDVALVARLFLGHACLSNAPKELALEGDAVTVHVSDGASGYRMQPAARSALNRAVTALTDARIEVAHTRLSPKFVKAERCYDTIFSYEVAQELARDRDRLPDAMAEAVRSRIDHGRRLGASTFETARRDTIALRSELLEHLEGDTVFLDAAVEGIAPPLEDDSGWSPMQALWALTGVPTLALPCGLVDGLPVGVQIVAAPGREDLLAKIACIIESRLGS